MDATWAELLHAVRAEAPDDDAATLVCADWLSERGDPRGEYIAIACRIARLPAGDAQRMALEARLEKLHSWVWLKPLVSLGLSPPLVERGFVRRAHLLGGNVANTGKLLRREPITRLSLASGGRRPSEIAAVAPELAYLRALELTGQYRNGQERILASPHLAGLDELRVRLTTASQTMLGSIVARPVVIDIDLDDNWLSAPRPAFWERARRIALGRLTEEGLGKLAALPLGALESLSLRGSRITAGGVASAGKLLSQLRAIDLSQCQIEPPAVPWLASHLPRIESLELVHVDIAGELLDAGIADRVSDLDLCYATYPRDALLRMLARNPHMRPTDERDLARLSNDALSERCRGLRLTPDEGW